MRCSRVVQFQGFAVSGEGEKGDRLAEGRRVGKVDWEGGAGKCGSRLGEGFGGNSLGCFLVVLLLGCPYPWLRCCRVALILGRDEEGNWFGGRVVLVGGLIMCAVPG